MAGIRSRRIYPVAELAQEGRATRAVARGLRDNYQLALDSRPPPSLTTGLMCLLGASTVSRRRVTTLIQAVDLSNAHVEVALPNLEDPLGIRRQRHTVIMPADPPSTFCPGLSYTMSYEVLHGRSAGYRRDYFVALWRWSGDPIRARLQSDTPLSTSLTLNPSASQVFG